MRRTLRLPLSAFLLTFGLVLPVPAFALGAEVAAVFYDLIDLMLPLLIPVAVLAITVAGITLVFATSEGAIAKARTTIIGVVIGTMLVMLTPVIKDAFYSSVATGAVSINVGAITAEALGIVGWLSAMAGMVGMLFVIISAISAVASFGQDEESYNKVRIAILHVIFGLIIISAGGLISNALTDGTPNPLMTLIVGKVQILLGLLTALSLAIVVYAGFRMVTNFGNDETYNGAKSLVLRVVAGLAVVLLAYFLTLFVTSLFG